MKYINSKNLADYAFLNEDCLVKPVRGVCVCFHGYTDDTVFESSPEIAKILGEAGIAWVFPYYSVWGWMGRESLEFCDQVLDAVWEKLELCKDVPLVSTGSSMGGMTSLMYCVRGKRKPIACAADCPVTDMWDFFCNNPSARRAILSAYILEDGELEAFVKTNSPSNNGAQLPRIPYFLLFGGADGWITDTHMPSIVRVMEEYGHKFTLRVEDGMNHCAMGDFPEAFNSYVGFILDSFEKNR
ncbi:MAG: hypothetical protein II350_01740 [Clostridia bacterium]|nr:hypothetical protein [Clostridia bacterium]